MAWAKANGHRVGKVHTELDESGGTVNRPKLHEAIRRVEAGDTGGIVVFKLDRFGRTLVDSLGLIERIEVAGGTFASVSDGFDLSTETGRLVLRFMLSLAEFELERIRGNWREARERAVKRGLHVTAIVPFGYKRRADGGLERHPTNGRTVEELFERRAGGIGWADLRRWMEAQNAKTQRGRDVWSLRAMRDIIRNDVYLGVASHGEFRQEGAHEALTDPVTWRRAQRRGKQTVSRAMEPALLSGLLRCAGCRYIMRAQTRTLADGRVVHNYRCRCGSEQAGRCPEPATASGTEEVEPHLVEQFFSYVEDLELTAINDGARLRELQIERDGLRTALDEYASDGRIQAAIGMDRYVAGLNARQAAFRKKQSEIEAEEDTTNTLPFSGEIGHLRADWQGYSVDRRRRLLALAMDCVFIRRGCSLRSRSQDLTTRIFICWRGTAPPDLPAAGKRGFVSRPFIYPNPTSTGVVLPEHGSVALGDGGADLAA